MRALADQGLGITPGYYMSAAIADQPFCRAAPAAEHFPAPEWASSWTGCGGASSTDECSGGQLCAPNPPDGAYPRLCIARAGARSCPAAFAQRLELYTGWSDDRSCSACRCDAENAECEGELLWGGCDSGSIVAVPVHQPCNNAAYSSLGRWKPAGVTADCAISGGGLVEGTASPTGHTTVCCRD